ncbi:MAG: PAS domain-containing protein [Cyanobacteriota bacterium]
MQFDIGLGDPTTQHHQKQPGMRNIRGKFHGQSNGDKKATEPRTEGWEDSESAGQTVGFHPMSNASGPPPAPAPAPIPPSIEELRQGDRPFVLADHLGVVIAINPPFQQAYGWSEEELSGEPISRILPGAFQMSHQLGFSRFQATEQSTILGHPLRLVTVCQDGAEVISEHFIVAEKRGEHWVFGATLTPLPAGTETDA